MMQSTNSMNNNFDNRTAVNVKWFKCASGNRYRKLILIGRWLTFIMLCMQIVRLYLVINDLPMVQYKLMECSNIMIHTFKGYVMVKNADRLCVILEVARYEFTSCGRQDPSRLHRRENLLKIWLGMFSAIIVSTTIIWILMPLFVNEYVEFTKLDGTVGYYRASVFNCWYPVTETMYNWLPIWVTIYTYETFILGINFINMLFFDLFLITMCIMIVGQFKTLSAAYETLGQQSDQVQHFSWSLSKIFNVNSSLLFIFHTKVFIPIKLC